MSQNAIIQSTAAVVSGATAFGNVNNAMGTLNTGWSGSSAPSIPADSIPQTGQYWLDTSVANQISVNRYTGSAWVTESVIDTSGGLYLGKIGGGTANVASASTANLGSVPQNFVNITGTTTITSFGSSVPAGQAKFVKFAGILTLTYNATSLKMPGSASITTAAGDWLIAVSSGSGNWEVISYFRAASMYVTSSGSGTVTSVSVSSANGFAGSVANPTTTPAITISTSITGVLKGNGTAISAAVSGTDYAPATSGSSILKASSGGFANAVAGTDYCGATSGSGVLKGSSGNTAAAVAGTDFVAPGTATDFTAQQNFISQSLTDGASISWNLASQQNAHVTLGGNRTLSNPTNLKNGGTYILRVVQDGTGSRTLAYGTAYKWPGGVAPTLSTAASAVDILTFVSDGTNMYGNILKAFA